MLRIVKMPRHLFRFPLLFDGATNCRHSVCIRCNLFSCSLLMLLPTTTVHTGCGCLCGHNRQVSLSAHSCNFYRVSVKLYFISTWYIIYSNEWTNLSVCLTTSQGIWWCLLSELLYHLGLVLFLL